MAKKIGMILNASYPHDIRVRKEAEALLKAGYELYLLCYRRRGEKREETVDGIRVRRVNIGASKVSEGIWDVINSWLSFHPLMGSALNSFIRDFKIDALHIHDLPLAATALKAGKKHHLNVIVDLHENYPEGIKIWFGWRRNPVIRLKNRIFFSYKRWLQFEKNAVSQADRVIAVVDEMKGRLIKDHDLSPEKITVVSNTESQDFLNQEIDPDIYQDLKGKFILLYAGNIGPHRGVDTLIESMQYLRDFEDIHLVIVGTASTDVLNYLYDLVHDLDLEERIHFKGYQPFDRFLSYMSQASVNVIPHKKNGHTNHTVPHKLFQSMMTGKPVLVSSCKPLKRIVKQTKSGEVFKAGNASKCADKILKLYGNPSKAERRGENGRTATVEGEFNWETSGEELVRLYGSLFS